MAAGDVYDAYFNSAEKGGIRTPQVYDPVINEWMQLVRNYVYTGAIWVPQKGAAGGETLVSLSDNSISDDKPVPTKAINSRAVVLAKGTTDLNGAPNLFVDSTRDFGTNFVNKLAKLIIDGVSHYRNIVSALGSTIVIDPVQLATSASVTLAGVGSLPIIVKAVGDEGNAYTIQLVAGAGLGSPMAHTLVGKVLTITSPTNGGGAPTDILAGNLQTYVDTDVELSALFDAGELITTGALSIMANPVSFTGGADAIVVPSGTEYEILDCGVSNVQLVSGNANDGKFVPVNTNGDEKFTVENPAVVQLSGSNVEGTLDAVAPTKANLVGGKYISADPAFHDGDLVPLRTNAKGEQLVNITGRKVAIPAPVNYGRVLNIAAGGNTVITITPPAGELWRIKGLGAELTAPVGATAGGTQIIIVRAGLNSSVCNVLAGTFAHNALIKFQYNQFIGGTSPQPATTPEQRATVLALVVSQISPLYFHIANLTDVAQTGTILLYLSKEVEYIV